MDKNTRPEKKKRVRLVTQQQKEMRRQEILSLAALLLVEGGYSKVRIRDIAKELGTSPASIYSYFDSKESILITLIDEGLIHLEHNLSAVSDDPEVPLKDKIMELARTYYQFATNFAYFYRLMFESSYEGSIYEDAPLKLFQTFQSKVISICNSSESTENLHPEAVRVLSRGLWQIIHGGYTMTEEIYKNTSFDLYVKTNVSLYLDGWKKQYLS